MKVLFYTRGQEQIGVEYLMSLISKKGHEVDLVFDPALDTNYHVEFPFSRKLAYKKLRKKVDSFKPDLVALHCNSATYPPMREFIEKVLKGRDLKIIVGGPHASTCPEFILKDNEEVDFVCIGEGEKPFLKLTKRLSQGGSIDNIKGLVYRKDGKIRNNGPSSLVQNLDKLPFPRKKEFAREGLVKGRLRIITGRGCPFSCSYCLNTYYKEIYDGYVRKRSPENVMKEIKHFIKRYDINSIDFVDETFTYNKKWVFDFLESYSREIDLPFSCFVRPETVDKEIAEKLAESGCELVCMGVESGNGRIRKEIMNREMDKELIIKSANALKKAGITLKCSAVFGSPAEGKKELWETLKLLDKINPDIVGTYTLYPFLKTPITNYLKKEGFMSEEDVQELKRGGHSLHQKLVFREDDLPYLFSQIVPAYIKFENLRPLLKKIIEIENEKLARAIYLMCIPLFYKWASYQQSKELIRKFIRTLKKVYF